MKKLNNEMNPTKLNLHPKLWKLAFVFFLKGLCKNQQYNTVKSMANKLVVNKMMCPLENPVITSDIDINIVTSDQ